MKQAGEVAEWLMAPVLKTGVPERAPGVRIPPSPPRSLDCREFLPLFPAEFANMPVFRDSSSANRTAENGLLSRDPG
jgi:hypothetical protein